MKQRQHLIIPAKVDQLNVIAQMAACAAQEVGFDAMQMCRIELAVDEACSNIIEKSKNLSRYSSLEVDSPYLASTDWTKKSLFATSTKWRDSA